MQEETRMMMSSTYNPGYTHPPIHKLIHTHQIIKATIVGALGYFLWVHIIRFTLNVYALRKIPGPIPVPVLGNLYDKTALTSVSTLINLCLCVCMCPPRFESVDPNNFRCFRFPSLFLLSPSPSQ